MICNCYRPHCPYCGRDYYYWEGLEYPWWRYREFPVVPKFPRPRTVPIKPNKPFWEIVNNARDFLSK